jgi:hypothetical protein
MATPYLRRRSDGSSITVLATDEQWRRWNAAAQSGDLGTFLARAADFYVARLQARLEMAQRMEREGRL